jgi:hypothetical protein
MKAKTKSLKRSRKEISKKAAHKVKTSTRRAKPTSGFSKEQREIAARVWPRISTSTKFVQLPEGQGSVSYKLPSGEVTTATLKWFTFTHGPRVFGHYDDANDICYIGEIIE